MAADEIKADIMSSIRGDISLIIREELKNALVKDFNALKSEPKSMQADITNNTAAIRAEINHVKSGHQGHELWTNYMVCILLQATVTSLQTQVITLNDRCEDMKGKMRWSNIRIVGIDEQPDTSSPTAVLKLSEQMEMQMEQEVKIDCSHHRKPLVIITKLHYDRDAAEILRRARTEPP